MLIQQGAVPYRDAFDHKPPVIYFAAASFHSLGPWGLWTAQALASAIASFLLFFAAKKLCWRWPLFYAFAFPMLLRHPLFIQGGGLTRELSASLTMSVFCIGVLRPKYYGILQGFLIATIVLTQQNELLGAVPLLVWSFIEAEEKRKLFLQWTVGCIALFASFALFFALHSSLRDFAEGALLFNLRYYLKQPTPFLERYRSALQVLWDNRYLSIVIVSVVSKIVASTIAPAARRSGGLFFWVLIAFFMESISISISDRQYPHYFLGIVPHILLLAGLFIKNIDDFYSKPIPVLPFLTQLCAIGLVVTLLPAIRKTPSFEKLFGPHNIHKYEEAFKPIKPFLQSVENKRGQFLAFRSVEALSLNTDFNIIAPTRWPISEVWDHFPKWDLDGTKFQNMIGDIDRWQTQYILDYSVHKPMDNKALQSVWDNYVNKNYFLVLKEANWRLYERKRQ
ncbi:MAG: hypothetical protein HY537_02330 [Deltaproteobacteria bacterium]|nr:hypothetical protein [Deltaproteobacteria bacterium]